MNNSLYLVTTVMFLAGCSATRQWVAETPPWQPGLVVDEVTALQVENPNVISNPPEGVAVGYDGATGINVIKAHRKVVGNANNVREVITPTATGIVNQ